jgi:hypothetical protein
LKHAMRAAPSAFLPYSRGSPSPKAIHVGDLERVPAPIEFAISPGVALVRMRTHGCGPSIGPGPGHGIASLVALPPARMPLSRTVALP